MINAQVSSLSYASLSLYRIRPELAVKVSPQDVTVYHNRKIDYGFEIINLKKKIKILTYGG